MNEVFFRSNQISNTAMKTIAIDMDEVITDTAKKLKAWYKDDKGIIIEEADIQGLNLSEAVIEEHAHLFLQYANTPGFFRDLDIMPDAEKVLEQLNERYQLFIVSAAMEFPESLKDKFEWINEKLPFISWKQICFCGMKSLIQTDIMIDDRTRNFTALKGRKILYSAHHNAKETAYERVNSWTEIADLLLG